MNTIAMTTEDSLILVRAMDRGHANIIGHMLIDDENDWQLMRARVTARQIDLEYEHYLEEQMHDWWRQQDEEAQAYEAGDI